MKRFAVFSLAMGLFMALGITACSGNTVDSALAFSAAMEASDAPAGNSPLTKAMP